MNQNEWLAERFEEHRTHLKAVAYRMLGSLSEADDAVQEAWLRLTRSDTGGIANLGGWLTTVVARVVNISGSTALAAALVRRARELILGIPGAFIWQLIEARHAWKTRMNPVDVEANQPVGLERLRNRRNPKTDVRTNKSRERFSKTRTLILITGMALFVIPAFGGEGQITASKALQAPPPMEQGPEGAPAWSFDLNGSYTMGSRIMKAGDFGSQAEYHYEAQVLRNIHLFKKYYLQIGFDHDQFQFSRSNATLFPYSLTSDAAVIAISYWSGDEYHPLLKLEPGIYYTRNHITKNSFNMPSGFKEV